MNKQILSLFFQSYRSLKLTQKFFCFIYFCGTESYESELFNRGLHELPHFFFPLSCSFGQMEMWRFILSCYIVHVWLRMRWKRSVLKSFFFHSFHHSRALNRDSFEIFITILPSAHNHTLLLENVCILLVMTRLEGGCRGYTSVFFPSPLHKIRTHAYVPSLLFIIFGTIL